MFYGLSPSLSELAEPHTEDSVLVNISLRRAVCQVHTGKGFDDDGRGADHHPDLPGWRPTFPLKGSKVGSRLRLPVVFLNGDGTAFLLPGAAVRTELFRLCPAVHVWSMISSLMEEQDSTQN